MKALTLLLYFVCIAATAQQPVQKQGRIYLSADQGETWRQADEGFPPDEIVNAWVAMDRTIFAGTDTHGIFVSSDQARSWHPSNRGLPRQVRIISLAAHKHLLFAGSHKDGLFISDDAGETWTGTNRGLNNLTIRSIYSYANILFAGTDNGLYHSVDDGKSWSLRVQGIQINSFSSSNRQLFVATNQGVLASKNGYHWSWIFTESAISSLAAIGEEIYLLDFFDNVYRSIDKDFTWIRADLYLPFQFTFGLTTPGRRFFTAEWRNIIKKLRSVGRFQDFGLPKNIPIMELLSTPYGLLAGIAGGKGC